MAKVSLNEFESYFVPFNTPSSKNSRVNTSKGSFFSPTVKKYLQKLGIKTFSSQRKEVRKYKNKSNLFEDIFKNSNLKQYQPLIIGFHPVRDSKRKFDLHNCLQIIGDLLQAHDLIEDDNADYFVPIPIKGSNGHYYSIDKENPGIYLYILNGKTLNFEL